MNFENRHKAIRYAGVAAVVAAAALLGGYFLLSSNSNVEQATAQDSGQTETDEGEQAEADSNMKPNIVLVHGAWADGSSWGKVIPILEGAGHRVIAVQLPLHSLADDVDTVKRAVALVGGPTILVGHSYGGFVITNAAYNNENVAGLVYVAAFAPDEGQSLSDFVDVAQLPKGLLVPDSAGFLYINSTQFMQAFAQDVNSTEAGIMATVQKPIHQSIFTQKSGPPAWKHLPTWYQVSNNDRMIPPDAERQFAKQMNATMISVDASHASTVSHPTEIAQLILNATEAAMQKSTVR